MSTNDLGFLCCCSASEQPLMSWENLPLEGTPSEVYACIVDHVEYWLDLQTAAVWINGERRSRGLAPISTERDNYLLHKYVCEVRWKRHAAARATWREGCL